MAGKRVKAKASEKLDDVSVKAVKALLEADKPITKKEACGMLRIAYNTTRLNNIIKAYEERLAFTAKMKKRNRGKKASEVETRSAIQEYIEGDPIADISKRMYRSSGFVKSILVNNNVPLRGVGSDYFTPELIPDEIVKEDYSAGDIVWSARYNTTAVIEDVTNSDNGLFQIHPEHGKVYRVWTYGSNAKFAYQPWYELGDLSHLADLGVELKGNG